ncbi:MAG: SDR family NAD(P)-dependent oxidoreductase, partial [bacterium]|nr:SDR family NAD(P)-dependent oxidoreductase [bacterium]
TGTENTTPTKKTEKGIAALEKLRAHGSRFIYEAGNICDIEFLQQTARRAEEEWGSTIDGVFHLAGQRNSANLENNLISAQTVEKYEEMYQAKIYGTNALYSLVENNPHALFVAYSSILSIFGAVGYSAYASANSYLDGFCRAKRNSGNPHTYSLNWSSWTQVGMSKNDPEHVRQTMKNKGYETITPEKGHHSLQLALTANQGQVIIGLDGSKGNPARMLGENPSGKQTLNLYYTLKKESGFSETAFQNSVSNRLTTAHKKAKIQLEIRKIDAIPMEQGEGNENKIDYRQLKNIETGMCQTTMELDMPTTETEKLLAEIWKKVLGRERIGIHENFFMLGGDSIKTIQISARMKQAGYQVEMGSFFRHSTIYELAGQVGKTEQNADQNHVTGNIPLTPIQERFFAADRTDMNHYNQAVMFYTRERFEKENVKRVFKKMQDHHDALRITYKEENDRIIQNNNGIDYHQSIQEYDYRKKNRKQAVETLEKEAERIQASINLEKGPLMKIALFHLEDGDRLLIVIHHLVIDGVSWRILFEDIETLLQQEQKGEPAALPPKTDSYKKWARQIRQYANSETF